MRAFRCRLIAASLAAAVIVSAGCGGSPPPPPTPHKDVSGGGAVRPRGEADKNAGKKGTPPRLDD